MSDGRFRRAWRRSVEEYRTVQRQDWIGFVLVLFAPVLMWLIYSLTAKP